MYLPIYLLPTLVFLQMLIVMSYWSNSKPMASATLSVLQLHWDSSQIFCFCPVSYISCSLESVGPVVHEYGRCRGRPTQIMDLSLVLPTSLPTPLRHVLLPCPGWIIQCCSKLASKGQIQLSHFHLPMSSGPVLLCCTGKCNRQGAIPAPQLSYP